MISERISITGAMLLLAAGFAQAQAPVDSGVVIQTETRVVLVDAIVTDKKGEYLRNLTAKDFKVWEDNKEQNIKSFSFESGAANSTNPVRRYIVLFFDNSTMDFAAQAQARQAAGKFIDANAGPNRMMAIVNFGGSIQIAQNFTDDAERLKRVVSGTKFAAVTPNGDSSMPDSLSKAAADFGVHDMLLALRSMAKNLNTVPGRKTLILFGSGFPLTPERMSEVTAAIDTCNKSNVAVYPIDVRGLMGGAPVAGLYTPLSIFPTRGLVASTASLPGSLLSGSTAFFQRGGTGGAPAGGGGAAGGGGRGGGGAPAPAPGGGGGRSGGAPAPAPAPGRGGNPVANPGQGRGMNPNGPFNPYNNPLNSNARNLLIPKMPDSGIDNQLFMHMLADGTGGFVIKNTNDLFAGLQKIGKELAEYYILGYTPPVAEEGACHSLKVKVDQGGSQVRARTGYCDSKSHDLLTKDMPIEKTLESRVTGAQPGNVVASMQLPYFYTGMNIARVNVAMEIPGSALKFDKVKGKFHAEMNILGVAYKPDGSVGARFSDTLKRDFEDKKMVEAFEKEPFHYENQFDVSSGQYKLKVAFTSGSDFGKLEMPLAIDPWQSKDFSISGLALSHQVRPTAEAGANMDQSLLDDRTPLITAGLQVIPAGSNRFSKTAPPLFYMEVYEPAILDAGDKQMAVGLQIRVLDRKSGEQKFSTGMMRVDIPAKSESPMVPLGERIPVDTLGAGQYIVEVQAESMTGSKVKRTADFDLE